MKFPQRERKQKEVDGGVSVTETAKTMANLKVTGILTTATIPCPFYSTDEEHWQVYK